MSKSDFEIVQDVLKTIEYRSVPENEKECGRYDSYDLFKRHIEGRYLLTPDELIALSKYTPIERYYWSNATMFPNSYLIYEDANGCNKCISELNEEEQAIFEQQYTYMIQKVYENQKNLGFNLGDSYLEFGADLIKRRLGFDSDENKKQTERYNKALDAFSNIEVDAENQLSDYDK